MTAFHFEVASLLGTQREQTELNECDPLSSQTFFPNSCPTQILFVSLFLPKPKDFGKACSPPVLRQHLAH